MTEVSVRFAWHAVGTVDLGPDGRLVFPLLPSGPGLYRYRLIGISGTSAYIGEASDLRRRAQHYRTPGPTQPTNQRMNARFREHIRRDGRVEAAIITSAELVIDGHAQGRHPLRERPPDARSLPRVSR